MTKYKLKDNTVVEAIPIGKSSVKIGEISPEGMLQVCDRGPNLNSKTRGAFVICKCKCGEYTLISLNSFRTNHIKSCGCYNKEYHKKTCKKIGLQSNFKDYTKINNPYYYFIKKLEEKDSSNSYFWEIECKFCGKHYKAIPVQLISYNRRGNNPCTCLRFQSKGCLKIKQLLENSNINYTTEKIFDSCKSPKGYNLRFDFYINNKYLIEYDGEQHFIPESFGGTISGEQRLYQQKEYDNIKNQWCINNHIPLIRIPYTYLDKIQLEDLLLESSKFIINKEVINE